MSDNDNQEAFTSFMTPKSTEEKSSGSRGILTTNSTKEALKQKREEKKEEEKKELEEAKKNSIALANRYGKGDMMKMQARNIIMMLPFIIFGAFIFLMILFKGGTWVNYGMNTLFKIMTGSK